MNIFVYSDESGVFDANHNEWFVYAGVVFLSHDTREEFCRKYIHAENCIRHSGNYQIQQEIKASIIRNKEKNKLFRALNNCIKFGVVIRQKSLHERIFTDKKTKQRYLDFAFKIGVKNCFNRLIREGRILPQEVKNIHFFVDEHSTATNGRYELQETLEQEFKLGVFNYQWNRFFPPIFQSMNRIEVKYCDSKQETLVRAADIVANKIYYCIINSHFDPFQKPNMYLKFLP